MTNPYNIQNISGGKIGVPIPVFSNDLDEGYIWLEGAEVSKTAYSKLYEVYGDDYGTPLNPENFVLPDFRGRVLWGSPDGTFGYLEATSPNITGQITDIYSDIFTTSSDALEFININSSYAIGTNGQQRKGTLSLNAHNSNPIYQDRATVRPPSIKCRVQTRYK